MVGRYSSLMELNATSVLICATLCSASGPTQPPQRGGGGAAAQQQRRWRRHNSSHMPAEAAPAAAAAYTYAVAAAKQHLMCDLFANSCASKELTQISSPLPRSFPTYARPEPLSRAVQNEFGLRCRPPLHRNRLLCFAAIPPSVFPSLF